MHRFVIAGAGLLSVAGFVGAASAADLAARPYTKAPAMIPAVYDWSGFYIGANGGWGSSHNCWDHHRGRTFRRRRRLPRSTGGMAGGQVGYRWQAGQYVFGLEAQGNWADFSRHERQPSCPASQNRTKIDAFGLFTGQVGYAWNNALLYVKGGAAVTDNRIRHLRGRRRSVARQRGDRHPLGRHRRRRHRIRLCAELVGRARIRPSVHGERQEPSPAAPAGAVRTTASVRTSTSSPSA